MLTWVWAGGHNATGGKCDKFRLKGKCSYSAVCGVCTIWSDVVSASDSGSPAPSSSGIGAATSPSPSWSCDGMAHFSLPSSTVMWQKCVLVMTLWVHASLLTAFFVGNVTAVCTPYNPVMTRLISHRPLCWLCDSSVHFLWTCEDMFILQCYGSVATAVFMSLMTLWWHGSFLSAVGMSQQKRSRLWWPCDDTVHFSVPWVCHNRSVHVWCLCWLCDSSARFLWTCEDMFILQWYGYVTTAVFTSLMTLWRHGSFLSVMAT